MINEESNKAIKEHIRICINNITATRIEEGLNQKRNDKYKSTVDWGYEDLNLKEDSTKIQLYMNSDILTLNNNKYYRVVKRTFQPNRPVMLVIDVEEIE